MTRRPGMRSMAASPTLVGAVTTLIIVVAVFLAYNANQGLPFVPVYRVSAEVPNAARVLETNEVRIGGHRVGVVETIDTVQAEDGTTVARFNFKLDKFVEPLSEDTQVRIRYKSSFGLKYVELTRGEGEPLAEGATIPASQFTEQVEFDEVYDTFDRETRVNSRTNLVGFGDAFAARGASINEAVENLNPLFRHLRPVMRNLADPDTQLARFFSEMGDAARIVAPVAETQAQLFTNMAITFAAFSADTEALKDTISKSPPTMDAAISSFRVQRPFLADFADLSRRLRPATAELRRALPIFNDAMEIGTPVLRRTPPMNRELGRTFASLESLVDQPATLSSLQRLDTTFDEARPLLDHVVPYQTVCNYWNHSWYHLWEHLSEQDSTGFFERVGPISVPGNAAQQGSLGAYGAGVQANGLRKPDGVFDPHGLAVLHGHPYGPAVDAQGNADCQAGQMGYLQGQLLAPGQGKDSPVMGVENIPGLRGTTFGPKVVRP